MPNSNNSVCAYPFFHMQIKPNGIHKPCCRFNIKDALAMQSSDGPFRALRGDKWEALRQQMLKGEKVAGCSKCDRQELNQGTSMRLNSEEASLAYHAKPLPEVELKFVEMAFGNFCNLRCRSCTGDLSSKWFDDERYLQTKVSFRHVSNPNKIINSNLIPTLDFETFRHVEFIKFTGGEPMLHGDFEPFLSFLVDAGLASQIHLRICTNATYFPKQSLITMLLRFSSLEISLSIDGIGPHNEYLRNPSSWPVVLENATRWRELLLSKEASKLNLCSTISALNLSAIPELISWWNSFNSKEEIIFQPVFDPPYLSPEILPQTFVKKHGTNVPEHILKLFSSREANGNNLKKFFEFNLALDQFRKESLFTVFPEFNELFQKAEENFSAF